jgi:hypothetical protein
MNFDFPKEISSLTAEQKLYFYEIFAMNLTICVRGIWSDAEITEGEKVDRMKWVNEIMHRVTAKICYLRLQQNSHSESDTWEIIKHWVSQNPAIGGELGWAIQSSYNVAVAKENKN